MGRVAIFIFLAMLILVISMLNFGGTGLTIHGNAVKTEKKVSSQVLEEIEQGDIRVMITLKSEIKKGRSITSNEVKEKVSKKLGKVKHQFDNRISAIISQEELTELLNDSEVESIEIVRSRSISLQDSVPLINATSSWNLQISNTNLTGEGETICIIDTGVNYNHADLGGCYGNNDETSSCKVIGGWDYCADDSTCTTGDSDPLDVHGHGSHVAGIAAANGSIKGVAPGSKIIMMKAANGTGTFWDDDLEKSIDWCVNNASTFNISVISMSLGGGLYSSYCNGDPLASSINNARANNISMIVASGNDGSTSQISAPSCHVNVTPVGGTDKSDGMYSSGNRNSLILLLAPGLSINSTVSSSSYALSSGTSMSTPHVAGAFAIINQYRRLEGLSSLIPSDIEDALNDSGEVIYDSGSGISFSRINIENTLKEMDESSPNIVLSSPSDNSASLNENQTFNCYAEDIQLANLTFYLWNSSGNLINETSFNVTSNLFNLEINQTLTGNGTYTWNCLGEDNQSNSAFANSNYTLNRGSLALTLANPINDFYTVINSTTFNCSVESTVSNLTNITLYVWNSSGGLIYNETVNISGSSNETTFDYNLTNESAYGWNCEAYNEQTTSILGDSNFTITYDSTNPAISLVSPSDSDSEEEGSISFSFSVSDLSNIENCNLLIDDSIVDTDSSISKDTTQTISESLTEGDYDWKIRCTDSAGNIATSSSREIEINEEESTTGGSTGGTTTNTTIPATTFIITDSSIKSGASKSMKVTDKMKFNIKNESHTLEVKEISSTVVKVLVTSDPVTVLINLGATKRIDLDNDKIYDLEITYKETINSLAIVIIKSIQKEISTRQISNETVEPNKTISGEVVSEPEGSKKTYWTIFWAILIVAIVLAGVGLLIGKKREQLGPVFKKKHSKKTL